MFEEELVRKRQQAQYGPSGELLLPDGVSIPDSASGQGTQTGKRGKSAVWIPVVTGVLALGLGASVGGANSSAEVAELRSTETSLTADVAELQRSEEVAVKKLDTAEVKRAESEKLLKSRDSEVAALKAETDTQRERIAELEAQLAEAQESANQAAAAAQSAANAPAPFAAAPAPAPAPAAPSGGGGSVYYKNCTAARAAGAAPVYEGQPGYGRHLDRDGDGIGCE